MPSLIPGIVSNCWSVVDSKAHAPDLEVSIEEAWRVGYRVIELRRGSLGRFESAEELEIEALATLPRRFSGLFFNIALDLPFLDPQFRRDDPRFVEGLLAAEAVAGSYPPHLRLVDLTTNDLDADPTALGTHLAELTGPLIDRQGILSIENAGQPWGLFLATFRDARRRLGAEAHRLRLCFDPVNLLSAPDEPKPAAELLRLSRQELSMIHIKQSDEGRILSRLSPGEVDWSQIANGLDVNGYEGPALFEMAPSADDAIWDRLQEARQFLKTCRIQFDS